MVHIFFILQLLIVSFSWAAVSDQPDRVSSETVRQRMYSGGRDEEDLNVQTNTPSIMRKLDAKAIQSQVLKGVKATTESTTVEDSSEF